MIYNFYIRDPLSARGSAAAAKERRPSKVQSIGSKDKSTGDVDLDGGDENFAPDDSIGQLHAPKISEEPELYAAADQQHGADSDSAGPPAYPGSSDAPASKNMRSSKT